jgi:hypothetical protein
MLPEIKLEGRLNRQVREHERVQEQLLQLHMKRHDLSSESDDMQCTLGQELKHLENGLQEDKLSVTIEQALDTTSIETEAWTNDRFLIHKLGSDA